MVLGDFGFKQHTGLPIHTYMLSEEKMPQATVSMMERRSLCLGFRVLFRTLIRKFEWQGLTLICKVSSPNVIYLRGVWRGLQQFTFCQHENCHNLHFVSLDPVGELI